MKNKINFIGIAGGSGAGKTTIAFNIFDQFREEVSVVHLDDYYKKREDMPICSEGINYDHPNAIDFNKCFLDLKTLQSGENIIIQTKNERDNPEYETSLKRKEISIIPKKYILVEGYLALFDKEIRSLFNTSFYIESNHDTRIKRRKKFIRDSYTQNILIPMHNKYVNPTKNFADHIIENESESLEDISQKIIDIFHHD